MAARRPTKRGAQSAASGTPSPPPSPAAAARAMAAAAPRRKKQLPPRRAAAAGRRANTPVNKASGIAERWLEQLANLGDNASRARYLEKRRASPQLLARLDDAVSRWLRSDLEKAANLAAAARLLADRRLPPAARAHALRAQANVLWFQAQARAATELHAQAIELFERAGQPLELARTLSTSMQPLILVGEYDRAQAAAARARELFAAAGDEVRLARLDINVGNIYHRQDRFAEAQKYYVQAFERLLPDRDPEGIIAALSNMAMCAISLNQFEQALAAHLRVRGFCEQWRMPLELIHADYNIAYLYYFRGEYGRAIELLRQARDAAQQHNEPYLAALCHLDLAEIYLELNLGEETEAMAQEAWQRFDRLNMPYEAGKALCFLALGLSQRRQAFRALEFFARARQVFAREKNQVWPSLIDLYQALVYFQEGRWFEARRYAAAALEFFRESPLPGRALLCRLLLARLLLKTDGPAAARPAAEEALAGLSGGEAPILAFQAHLLMGEIEEALRAWDAARQHYLAAQAHLESLRSQLHGEELKIAFMQNRLEVYENLVQLCLRNGDDEAARAEAWGWMEKAKSRTLHEILARGGLSATEDHSRSDWVRRIRGLREQLNWYYHRIEAEQLGQAPASAARLLELREHAEKREQELVRVLRDMPASEAERAGLADVPPVALEELRPLLEPDTALLEFFRVRQRIYAALISVRGLEIVPLTLASRIEQLLRLLQFQLSKFSLGAAYVREASPHLLRPVQAHLRELDAELLAPLRSRLTARKLVIVPHELLHSVPFHALWDGERYLLDSLAVSYAPSASVYVHCRRRVPAAAPESNPPANSGALILGVPDAQAPCILDELQAVAAALPGARLFIGARAGAGVLREHGPHSRIIHIATHGYFRQDNPLFSGIRLGDGYLNLHDLYSLQLPAELIALSGCSTGLHAIAAGDELLGLSRGLLHAGARTLLLSMWDVNDRSTATLMGDFYNHFNDLQDPAEALRRAMLSLREAYPHPYYWAPFILYGA